MIDVLLTTYNGEKYLDDQIRSIFQQDYKEWRIIAHDDGSTDNTLQILNKWQQQYPECFYLLEDGIKTGGAKIIYSPNGQCYCRIHYVLRSR